MNVSYINSVEVSFFSDAKEQLDALIHQLESENYSTLEHGDIESHITKQGNEILRLLLQGWLDKKSSDEKQHPHFKNASGESLNNVRHKTKRKLTSLFGDVNVSRKSYGKPKQNSIFPIDAELNIPTDQYSDGVRKRLSKEVIKSSFDDSIESISEITGAEIPKRQSLNVVRNVAQDFENYYEQNRFEKPEDTSGLLVLTFDGKGIVMRHDSLRECTKKSAEKNNKLNGRLSPGEKKDRKRMAQVAAVYTAQPYVRTSESVMNLPSNDDNNVLTFRSPVLNKRVWASVEREAESVINEAFLEALQRDPKQEREWVVLIDGLPHQINLIKKIMNKLKVKATIVMDFIHVLEYLWKAAWCLFESGDPKVEAWIDERAIKILNGDCSQVAKGIRLSATKRGLTKREGIDKCANYLLNNKPRLQYGKALAAGFPIASGVIEGACRHLINDRLDITGARWSLVGAEALLKLRSLKSSGDFDKYWDFHKLQEKNRNYNFLEQN
jgi:hypothetical protein